MQRDTYNFQQSVLFTKYAVMWLMKLFTVLLPHIEMSLKHIFLKRRHFWKTFMVIYLGSNPPAMIPPSGLPQAKTV